MNKEFLANRIFAIILFAVSLASIFIDNDLSGFIFALPFVVILLLEKENAITGYHPCKDSVEETEDLENMENIA